MDNRNLQNHVQVGEEGLTLKELTEKKQKIMKAVKILFLLLTCVFLIKYFYTNYDDFKNLDVSINWKVFSVSILFYFLYKLTLASLWHYMTKLNGAAISYPKAVMAYLYSILGKYIPGKVFMLLARLPAYEEKGIKMGKVTVCFLLENICTLLGAAFLFLISLFFFPNDILYEYKWVTTSLVIALFICINPKIINFFLRIIEKLIKKERLIIPISYIQMLKIIILFILNWIILGFGFYMLTCSIYPVPESKFLYISGIYGLSCIIGILAVFSPSGIGIREGILLIGLRVVMDSKYAVIVSIVSRLWATAAELFLIGIAFIIKKLKDIGFNCFR